jgi:hypothetical protein
VGGPRRRGKKEGRERKKRERKEDMTGAPSDKIPL